MSSHLGEILVKLGKITPEELSKIEEQKDQYGGVISTTLIKSGLITEEELTKTLGQQYKIPTVELNEWEPNPDVIKLIPQALANKHLVLPMKVESGTLTIAMVDPSNVLALNDIKFLTGHKVQVVLAGEGALKAQLERAYDNAEGLDNILSDLNEDDVEVVETEDDFDAAAIEKASEDAPVVKLVNAILTDAIRKNVSDIHIEPYEKVFRVRFRIDGVLYEIMKPPLRLKNAITSRIKIMADLDIAERRLPQDGRIKLKLGSHKEMDYRVSVLPGIYGEKVVLRLLDKSNLQTDMTKLGFSKMQLADFKTAISKPYGLVLVTGPTGSGKTTTLYSGLTELNKPTTNISTAEDPVEFNLMGINQVQMHDDIGLNFAAALRSFLRQDPDIIMVGEIRDYETAEIAIKASLTGHLVLSTLHTNDAPSTINRMLNMGVEPFLVASSINIIVAQRLARRICENCKEKMEVRPDVLVSIGIPASEAPHLEVFYGKGCSKCSGTGYKGRIALYEALTMTEGVKELVLNGASAAEIKRFAVKEGMATLRKAGLENLRQGTTTIEEVLRTTVGDD